MVIITELPLYYDKLTADKIYNFAFYSTLSKHKVQPAFTPNSNSKYDLKLDLPGYFGRKLGKIWRFSRYLGRSSFQEGKFRIAVP
jgi:hypothetical protein